MAIADHIDLRDLPESAQQEVYDFYLFVRQRVLEDQKRVIAAGEGALAQVRRHWLKTGIDLRKTKHGKRSSRRRRFRSLSLFPI